MRLEFPRGRQAKLCRRKREGRFRRARNSSIATPNSTVVTLPILQRDTSMAQEPVFQPGQRVRRCSSREQVGTVVSGPRGNLRGKTGTQSRLEGHESQMFRCLIWKYLQPEEALRTCCRKEWYASRETLATLLTFVKLQFPVRNNVYALHATRTRFLHYQFKPRVRCERRHRGTFALL